MDGFLVNCSSTRGDIYVPGTYTKLLRSGQSDILVPVQQYKHGVGSPLRGARSGGHDACQAVSTAANRT